MRVAPEISHSTWLFARAGSHAIDRLLARWREACEMRERGRAAACKNLVLTFRIHLLGFEGEL